MKAKTMVLMTLAIGLFIGLSGFKLHKKVNPEDLGFYRARVDERGLIEFAIDQVRQDLKNGRSAKQTLGLETAQIDIGKDKAVVYARVHDGLEKTTDVELTLAKTKGQWQVVATKGLAAGFRKSPEITSRSVSRKISAYEIYTEVVRVEKTLVRTALSPDLDIDKLTKSVTMDKLDRQLFEKPHAGVLFSSVTQLNNAPYFVARYVQLVTDPAWNRIVYGDYEGWIKVYGNTGRGSEDLNRPHGIDRDVDGRIYVADTGNNRIVVLKLEGSGEETELAFEFAFGSEQLIYPYDVAWDDRGTPFDNSDDIIWAVDSGNDRVIGYALAGNSATVRYIYGETGNGEGAFFNPKALAVGRFNGLSNGALYVADTGNRRIVKLQVLDNRLEWGDVFTGKRESQFTSITIDHWGSLYVTDRSYTEIHKLSSALEPLATLAGDEDSIVDPVNFHTIFGEVYVQSEDRKYWAGYDQAFLLEKWTEKSGGERYQLGLDLKDFSVKLASEMDQLLVDTKLTDHGKLTLTVFDAKSDRIVRQIPLGWMIPGDKEIVWDRRDDIGWQVEPGFYRLKLTGESSYGNTTTSKETPEFYLPLHYREDSGSDTYRDSHLVQGVRNTDWGAEPHQTIATHPSEVVYRFTDLNPTVDYEIKAEFYNKDGDYLKQRITVDGTVILEEFEVPAGLKQVDWLQLPGELYADGALEVRIEKTAGDRDAMISQLWIKEANYDPANPPALQETAAQVPDSYTLAQNFPNPFNPTTTIQFGVPDGFNQRVTLRVYNVLGQSVKKLVDGNLAPGVHSVVWNGKDAVGRPIASGVYFYELKAGDFVSVKKLIMMK